MIVTNITPLINTLLDMESTERYAIDTETTGLRPWGDTTLRGISMSVRGETFYLPITHPGSENLLPTDVSRLSHILRVCKAMPIYHNANYDRAILERGINLAPPQHYRDTALLAWLTDENRRKALKELGAYFFGTDAKEEQTALKAMMKGHPGSYFYKELRAQGVSAMEAREQAPLMSAASKRTWADLTAEEIAPYAEQDARLTYDLYDRLLADREYPVVEPAVQRMHDLQSVVYRMVKRGVQINPDEVRRQKVTAELAMADIRTRFTVNLDSPKQLAALIYEDWGLPIKERTDTGAPSTSRATLEAMAGLHSGLDEILSYRRYGKAVSTYYNPFLDAADEANRIHPSVNVVGTVTGRFSYSDPNLQTLPRDGTISGIKDCIVATPGRILVSYDLKSAELRFMASLAGEQDLIDKLAAEEDLYQEVADRIGVTRQVGKSLVLSWPYGVGPVKFSRASGLSVKDSRNVIASFENAYRDLSSTMSKLSTYADFHGRLPLLAPGRFRRFVSPALAYPIPSYTALNAACQGGVADFMGDVMIGIEPYAETVGAWLVLQVHDSLVFEVIPGTEHDLLKALQALANEVNPLSMPLTWKMDYGV